MTFKSGLPTKPPPYWPRVRKRLHWAIQRAGYDRPKIRYYFRAYLKEGDDQLMGFALTRTGSGSIWIATGLCAIKWAFVDTMLHEIAHVLAGQIESPEHPHEHSDLWGLIHARLYRAYVDDPEGPK